MYVALPLATTIAARASANNTQFVMLAIVSAGEINVGKWIKEGMAVPGGRAPEFDP